MCSSGAALAAQLGNPPNQATLFGTSRPSILIFSWQAACSQPYPVVAADFGVPRSHLPMIMFLTFYSRSLFRSERRHATILDAFRSFL
jgi:hypothetical protein